MNKNIVAIVTFVALIAAFSATVFEWRRPAPVDSSDWCGAHQIALSKCET